MPHTMPLITIYTRDVRYDIVTTPVMKSCVQTTIHAPVAYSICHVYAPNVWLIAYMPE